MMSCATCRSPPEICTAVLHVHFVRYHTSSHKITRIIASFILKHFVIGVFVHEITGIHQNCLLILQVFYLVENAVAFLTLFESCIKISFLVLCIGVVLSFLSFIIF